MKDIKDIEKELGLIKRGTVEIISEEELQEKLQFAYTRKKPLKIKAGFDPSAPDLHLGHTVLLRKLKLFQELGHIVYFLIGDFTARIGDPSGRSTTRRPLSKEEVEKNVLTYEQQIFKILERKRTKIVYNSSWCEKMKFEDILDLASRYTVARLLERDDFLKRYKENKPITLLEFFYPLIQGYDSVVLEADVEMGGTDQKFNLLVGRELMRDYGKSPQVIITLPLLEGTDGKEKMSKSLDNYIGINESPKDMFGKIMSIPDEIMPRYYELLTDLPLDSLKNMHPREAKFNLAKEIVSQYYGKEKAEESAREFDRVFRMREIPQKMEVYRLPPEELKDNKIWIVKLMRLLNFASSNAEARRLISQGGVTINGERVTNPDLEIEVINPLVIKAGKLKFARVLPAQNKS
ncbi:MAG: tyrosine--tRNA ligase [Candidatus Omnitrophica bacterium]|nr:tyrosine--tRNA ligase [Candidatus Omnitrophota bacterium]MCM8793067.1 tyrosine--tRNA ligase [Candidatus Omnitrophota bacterium]